MTFLADEITHKGKPKVDHYGWQIKDEPGRQMALHKAELQVDMQYQRSAKLSDPKVLRIVRAWSWIAAGVIIVGHRDSQYFVIDGQHRVLAARKRSDIQTLPCLVFETQSAREEAEGFVRANRERKPMNSIDSFKALVMAGDETALFVRRIVEERGLVVKATASGAFAAPGILLKLAAANRDRARRAFSVAADICLPQNIHNDIIKGLATLDARLVDADLSDARIRNRLISVGRDELLRSIAKAKAFRGVGGDRVLAEGILAAINNRLRKKIEADI